MSKKKIAVISLLIAVAALLNVFIFKYVRVGSGSLDGHMDRSSLIVDIILCIILDLIVIFTSVKLETVLELPTEVISNRRLIASLSKNDFKTRFAGSYLGTIWAFIQPIVTVVVYWFVFEVGLRAGRDSEYPFILWLMAGLVPWFFFSEAWSGGTNSLLEYNYLVKKVVFKIDILPIVKVLSALFTHAFFTVFVFVLCCIYGYRPGLYTLQLVYYIFCSFMLVLGLSYFTSAVVCFFKDLTQIINIILQVGIWMTPIMWDVNILSPALRTVFKLNPVYYIVDGFRDALLTHNMIGDKLLWTVYFWLFIAVVFSFGTSVFRKLKIHFADVL